VLPTIQNKNKPYLIAGPCSAETEMQVMETAEGLLGLPLDYFRAGIWKPRTKPGGFEGVGSRGLKWLKKVKEQVGFKTITEVANKEHVNIVVGEGIDAVWIGARTTVNPFLVQELAEALSDTNLPVFIKNPINPDIELWAGAIERFLQCGIEQLAVIHRGFSNYSKSVYRNKPQWEIPLELRRRYPTIPIICDPSHICGNTFMLFDTAQKAVNLQFDGHIIETHRNPNEAWSDAKQQLSPFELKELLHKIVWRTQHWNEHNIPPKVQKLRATLDKLDDELLTLLAKRMKISSTIGEHKRADNVSIYQHHRWMDILNNMMEKGTALGMSDDFLHTIFQAIHQESIRVQDEVMNNSPISLKPII